METILYLIFFVLLSILGVQAAVAYRNYLISRRNENFVVTGAKIFGVVAGFAALKPVFDDYIRSRSLSRRRRKVIKVVPLERPVKNERNGKRTKQGNVHFHEHLHPGTVTEHLIDETAKLGAN